MKLTNKEIQESLARKEITIFRALDLAREDEAKNTNDFWRTQINCALSKINRSKHFIIDGGVDAGRGVYGEDIKKEILKGFPLVLQSFLEGNMVWLSEAEMPLGHHHTWQWLGNLNGDAIYRCISESCFQLKKDNIMPGQKWIGGLSDGSCEGRTC